MCKSEQASNKEQTEATLNRGLGWSVLAAEGFTAVVIVVLHVLRPDLDPYSRAISEYVNGPYGTFMTIAFFSQSLGAIALAVSVIRAGLRQRRARIGSALFIVAAMGGAVAGVFPTDPASPYPQTSTGAIHAVAGLIRFLSLSLALPLLSSALRANSYWRRVGKALTFLATQFVLTFLGSIFVLANLNLFGLGQRVFIATLLVWMSIAAYPMIRYGNDKW